VNELQRVFEFDGQQVRAKAVDGRVWFAAKDICAILDISNHRNAVAKLNEGQKGVQVMDTPGGPQEMAVITEAGVYKIAFTSQKPEAERFTDWVAEEVLPTIRKTGGYVADGREVEFIDRYFPTLSDETKKAMILDLQRSVQLMKPKADYFDALVERNLLTNFRDTAKQLKVRQSDFMAWLEAEGYIYRDSKGDPKPYAQYTPDLFQIKEFTRGNYAGTQTLITPKGRETFRLLLKEAIA